MLVRRAMLPGALPPTLHGDLAPFVEGRFVSVPSIEDPADSAAFALLRRFGADRMPHRNGRTLFAHLAGLARIVSAWGAPERVRRAALFHSVYGTSVYRSVAAGAERRSLVRATIGSDAEQLAFAFGCVDRPRFSSAVTGMIDAPIACDVPTRFGKTAAYEPSDVLDLATLGAANEFEQTCAEDGSPAPWRVWCRPLVAALARWRPADLSEAVFDSLDVPNGVEAAAVAAYTGAISAFKADDRRAATAAFNALAALPMALAEPFAWLAEIESHAGDAGRAAAAAATARKRLLAWGAPWDKRLSFEQWLMVVAPVERGARDARERSLLRSLVDREG